MRQVANVIAALPAQGKIGLAAGQLPPSQPVSGSGALVVVWALAAACLSLLGFQLAAIEFLCDDYERKGHGGSPCPQHLIWTFGWPALSQAADLLRCRASPVLYLLTGDLVEK